MRKRKNRFRPAWYIKPIFRLSGRCKSKRHGGIFVKWIICFGVLVFSNCYAERIEVKSESFDAFDSLLNLGLRIGPSDRFNDPATGFYTTDEKGELDGEFQIKAEVSGYDKVMKTHYTFKKSDQG